MFRAAWRHVKYNYDEGGLRQILSKVLWRTQQWLWSDDSWLVYKMDLAGYNGRTALHLEHRTLDFETLRLHNYFKALAFPEGIQARFDSGVICHGFFIEDQLLNVAWSSKGYLEIEPGVVVTESDSYGVFDCYTFPEHRSKGVYKESLIQLARTFQQSGTRTVLIAVDPGNIASIKGIERAGFEPLYCLTRSKRYGRALLRRSQFAAVTAVQ